MNGPQPPAGHGERVSHDALWGGTAPPEARSSRHDRTARPNRIADDQPDGNRSAVASSGNAREASGQCRACGVAGATDRRALVPAPTNPGDQYGPRAFVMTVKQAKALGLHRWPSRHWTINVAWTQIVALAAQPAG